MKGCFEILVLAAMGTDARARRIPDAIPAALVLLGLLELAAGTPPGVAQRLFGAAVGLGMFLVILLIRPGAFGGGDVKLLAAGGGILGARGCLIAFALGILLCGGYLLCSGCLLWCRDRLRRSGRTSGRGTKKERELAFGVFLGAGMILARWFQEEIWAWYIG